VAYSLFLTKLLVHSGIAKLLPRFQRLTDGGSAFLHYYSDRVLSAPLTQLRETAPFLELHGPDAIDLAQGAPRFDIVPSTSTKLPADRRGWPPAWGLLELREAVADSLRAEQRWSVNPHDEVLITQGAAGALGVLLDTFVNAGDRVVLFDPTSPLYTFALMQRRARIGWVPTWMEKGRIRFQLDQLARAMRGARLVIVNSPANPTGGVFAAEDLEQIAWWAERRDVLMVQDGVFEPYQYEGSPLSIGALATGRRRTLTVGSVSKGYALASARVGWLAGHRHLVRPCTLSAVLHTPFVPTLCQQIALAALRQGRQALEPIRAQFDSRRHYTFERLQALSLQPAWPAGAFFFWLPVHPLGVSGREFAEKLLRAKKVLVTPGEPFGPSGQGHVRLSYAAEDGRLREGLSRLAEFLRQPHVEASRQTAQGSQPRESEQFHLVTGHGR
jgi:aspartate/methionine/tyrosine aminotransferase